jgi:hypothetical protein
LMSNPVWRILESLDKRRCHRPRYGVLCALDRGAWPRGKCVSCPSLSRCCSQIVNPVISAVEALGPLVLGDLLWYVQPESMTPSSRTMASVSAEIQAMVRGSGNGASGRSPDSKHHRPRNGRSLHIIKVLRFGPQVCVSPESRPHRLFSTDWC